MHLYMHGRQGRRRRRARRAPSVCGRSTKGRALPTPQYGGHATRRSAGYYSAASAGGRGSAGEGGGARGGGPTGRARARRHGSAVSVGARGRASLEYGASSDGHREPAVGAGVMGVGRSRRRSGAEVFAAVALSRSASDASLSNDATPVGSTSAQIVPVQGSPGGLTRAALEHGSLTHARSRFAPRGGGMDGGAAGSGSASTSQLPLLQTAFSAGAPGSAVALAGGHAAAEAAALAGAAAAAAAGLAAVHGLARTATDTLEVSGAPLHGREAAAPGAAAAASLPVSPRDGRPSHGPFAGAAAAAAVAAAGGERSAGGSTAPMPRSAERSEGARVRGSGGGLYGTPDVPSSRKFLAKARGGRAGHDGHVPGVWDALGPAP
jgi:hypothetical protein